MARSVTQAHRLVLVSTDFPDQLPMLFPHADARAWLLEQQREDALAEHRVSVDKAATHLARVEHDRHAVAAHLDLERVRIHLDHAGATGVLVREHPGLAVAIGTSRSWAIRSPGAQTKSIDWSVFNRTTRTSPR